jgi:putative ABC transport system permease protein
MLRHDLVSALRRISHNKLHSFVGITALALGLACFLAAYMFVDYLRHFDGAFAGADRTYVVAESMRSAQFGIDQSLVYSALPVAERLRLEGPELERVARVYRMERAIVADGEASLGRLAFAESDFFEIFNFAGKVGDVHGALRRPATAVATRRAAERLFGTTNVVGRAVTVKGARGEADVTIAAVLGDIPQQSHLAPDGPFGLGFDLVVSWDVFEAIEQQPWMGWGNASVMTYVRLPANGEIGVAELDRRLAAIVANRADPLREVLTIGFTAKPVSSISGQLLQQQFEGPNGKWRVDVLASVLLLGGGLLLVACLNFTALATAEASGRVLEIGARKSLGASRRLIARQELTATAVRAALGIALALVIVQPAGLLMTGPWRLALTVPWGNPGFWVFLVALLGAVSVVAGIYPALLVARLRPVDALRIGRAAAGKPWFRTALVATQFAVASFLVFSVTVLLAQRDSLRDTLLGRFDDPYVIFFLGPAQGQIDADVLSTELRRNPVIKGAASMSQPPFQAAGQKRELARGQDSASEKLMVDAMLVGRDYFEIMQVPLLAGRVFSRDRADDQTPLNTAESDARAGRPVPIVLDRAAAHAFGWVDPADAIGQVVFAPGNAAQEVIGVVDDVPQAIRSTNSVGRMYSYNPRTANFWVVHVAKNSVEAAVAHVESVMRSLAPLRPPPSPMFLDDLFANAYWTFALTNRVLATLAVFALSIAAVGLFGMASYMTARRTREIGLRKSQGARTQDIFRMLLWDFAKPALWANLVALPIAVMSADRYLDLFETRVALGPPPFAVALVGTVLLAWMAASGFVARAAYLRPAEALRQA